DGRVRALGGCAGPDTAPADTGQGRLDARLVRRRGACNGSILICLARDSPGPLLARITQVIDVSGNSTPVSDLPCSPAMEGPNSGGQSPSLATCPAWGGESPSQRERHEAPQLIIVADDRARLYELFQRAFAYDATVHVPLARRAAQRRP